MRYESCKLLLIKGETRFGFMYKNRKYFERHIMKTHRKISILTLVVVAVLTLQVFSGMFGNTAYAAERGGGTRGGTRGGYARNATPEDTKPRTIAPYFTKAASGTKAPDSDGFIQRWVLLEPIANGLLGNTGFTETYIRNAFINTEYFPNQFKVTPKDGDKVTVNNEELTWHAGDKVTVNNEELTWHALDSNLWNVKLFRFAYGLNKTFYGITFFAYTVVESPREIKDIRMAVGSNSASMWWLNGEEVVGLYGDRRMVMDDCVSKRLTLKQGKNVIRGIVINGPGMSDFCVRFIDEEGKPVKDIAVNLEN